MKYLEVELAAIEENFALQSEKIVDLEKECGINEQIEEILNRVPIHQDIKADKSFVCTIRMYQDELVRDDIIKIYKSVPGEKGQRLLDAYNTFLHLACAILKVNIRISKEKEKKQLGKNLFSIWEIVVFPIAIFFILCRASDQTGIIIFGFSYAYFLIASYDYKQMKRRAQMLFLRKERQELRNQLEREEKSIKSL